ncbi:P-loop containing nucleoside triphosphate hydrolase protein [Corynespora cassiicola Philippines]|uniref:P-loop containing nucleoside triphosphate hydrolase protein n=1 Tax=Corynespora cassiicola Philippines TaxID=1448308 RepID=A0A2T2NZZ0_CORCC|nr:P-loop containing nucleoside triphosphate hydrolase protein [Corynespora cassiicola Philippines]
MSSPIQIISVLGGPGSGKGTQCTMLETQYENVIHFSIGDLLRKEAADPDSPHRETIQENMCLGRVGPKEITVAILRKNIEQAAAEGMRFLFLDGFPRKLDQAEYFEEQFGLLSLVLSFECSDNILVQRLAQRGRNDDDTETIKKRIDTYHKVTSEVLDLYEKKAKVVKINANTGVDTVFAEIQKVLEQSSIQLCCSNNIVEKV